MQRVTQRNVMETTVVSWGVQDMLQQQKQQMENVPLLVLPPGTVAPTDLDSWASGGAARRAGCSRGFVRHSIRQPS